jgi:hypothetical protein
MDDKGQVYFGAEDALPPEDRARFVAAEAEAKRRDAERLEGLRADLEEREAFRDRECRRAEREERIARAAGSRVSGAEGKVPREMEGK